MTDTHCALYVTTTVDEKTLIKMLCSYLERESLWESITCDKYEIDFDENEEFDIHKQKDFPDGFLFFRYRLDVVFLESETLEYCIEEVSKILQWMWGHNFPVVAACDYEDFLPEKGGGNSKNIPWPK